MKMANGMTTEYLTTVGLVMVTLGLALLARAHRRTDPKERDGAMTGAFSVLAPGTAMCLAMLGRWFHGVA